jgi:hypothetical protein
MDLEVLMLQCVKCVNALFVVQAQQAFQEIKTFWLEVLSKALVDITPLLLPFLDSFAARQGRPARHVRFVRWADELEDSNTLIDICATFEDGLSFEHLSKDAASFRQLNSSSKFMQLDLPNSPHVDRRSVLLEREKQLWWAVPPRDNETSVVSHRFAIAFSWLWRQAFVVPGKTEVCNL